MLITLKKKADNILFFKVLAELSDTEYWKFKENIFPHRLGWGEGEIILIENSIICNVFFYWNLPLVDIWIINLYSRIDVLKML